MSSQTRKYRIALDITTTAPMHITAIEKGTYDPERKRLNRYDAATGIGCSLTRTMKIASAAVLLDDNIRVPEVPVIPASTIAGKVRRAAADLIFSSLTQRDLTVSVDAYNTMTSGMASTELKADKATPETVAVARRDPFLGLFGGTSFALSASCVIAEGWPLIDMTRPMLMSEPLSPVLPLTDLRDMTTPMAIIRKNDAADLAGEHLENVVGRHALATYVQVEGDRRTDSKAKKAAADNSKKIDLRTFNAVETINAGMSFALRFEVVARTPAHLGLMLLSIQKVLRNGQIGGKAARGMGRFVCSASRLYEVDPTNRESTVLTNLFLGQETGYGLYEHEIVNEAVLQASDYIDQVDPRLLNAFAAADAKAIKQLTEHAAEVA
jgi:CRISPR type IV-associated protein Csf2